MTAAQVKEAESIANEISRKNEKVFAKESALAQAKAIQGLRAVFDEVWAVKGSVEVCCHGWTRTTDLLLTGRALDYELSRHSQIHLILCSAFEVLLSPTHWSHRF